MEATLVLLVKLAVGTPLPVPTEFVLDSPPPPEHVRVVQLAQEGQLEPEPVHGQICTLGPWAGDGATLCFIVPSGAVEDNQVRYRLGPGVDEPAAFRFEEDDARLRLLDNGAEVLGYNHGMILPEGVPENRRRSSYVHPLNGLDGEMISDDFPKDHYHHRGLFWSWPKLSVGGQTHDLWAISGVKARFEEWLGQEVGPVCAVFGVRNGWYVGEKRIMAETVWFRVWRAGDVGQAIDVALEWEAQGEPVTISPKDAKGYGGFCLRFAPREGTVLTTADGRQEKDSNMQPAPWADLSARFAGRAEASGAALLQDPGNPGFPNGWCLRHYGFLGVNWPGLETATLQPGQPVTARYRVWVHRGGADEAHCGAAYEAFTNPPRVELTD